MAARGFVHSAVALHRSSGTVPCIARAKRLRCRLLAFEKSSRGEGPAGHRGMASTPVPKGSLARQTASKTKYEEAIVALNSLQSNAETIRKSIQSRSEARKHNIPNMVNYLQRVGLSVADVDNLSVIHVTGTKGKGSTCAFTESILRQYGYKTGIFSSPHLIEARERIRINGRPVDRELFSNCFWDVYEKLIATKDENSGLMPHYFSFLTVMAFYIFVRENIDVAVLEVGIGGEYDSTNVVQKPIVCGVSSLDLDHTNLLGHTLEDIAWHKAGIFKKGAPGVTVPQPESPLAVILQRARERQCPLYMAQPLPAEELSVSGCRLGIAGDRQRYNAALAVQLCRFWLELHNKSFEERVLKAEDQSTVLEVAAIPRKHSTQLSKETLKGLSECQWPGRTQTIVRPGVTYYLDGAHTTDSMQQCVEWFQQAADTEMNRLGTPVHRALVFNMTGDRPVSLLLKLLRACGFHRAAFCPNIVSTKASENIPDQLNLTVEQQTMMKKAARNCRTWEDLFAGGDAQSPTTLTVTPPAILNGLAADSSASNSTQPNGHAPSDWKTSVDSVCEQPLNGGSRKPFADGIQNGGSHSAPLLNGASPVATEPVSLPQCESAQFPCIASALHWATQGRDSTFLSSVSIPEEDMIVSPAAGDTLEVPHIQVLVTGSLHLVGGVLELLIPDMNE